MSVEVKRRTKNLTARRQSYVWCRIYDESGQATVEAAFLIPTLLLTLLLLIQPGILLYTYLVMESAAAETCRIVATESLLEQNYASVDSYAKRRLAAIPQQENFHVHDPACTWFIDYGGNETTGGVEVEIQTEVKPLPFFDFGLDALGLLNQNGNIVLKAHHYLDTKSDWVRENPIGSNPTQWIERWKDS